MATIRTSMESARGCGYRAGGGLYLVSGGIPRSCGKLPIPLTVCPTCSTGIKPARGWTWVQADAIIDPVVCDSQGDYCSVCPLSRPLGRAGLLWIGEKFYPTPLEWMEESLKMGVSRRISHVPKELELGKTWVLVAHRKAIKTGCPHCEGSWQFTNEAGDKTGECGYCEKGYDYTPAIFHAFLPTAIEYIVKGDETDEELTKLEKRGLSLVKVIRDHPEARLYDDAEDIA